MYRAKRFFLTSLTFGTALILFGCDFTSVQKLNDSELEVITISAETTSQSKPTIGTTSATSTSTETETLSTTTIVFENIQNASEPENETTTLTTVTDLIPLTMVCETTTSTTEDFTMSAISATSNSTDSLENVISWTPTSSTTERTWWTPPSSSTSTSTTAKTWWTQSSSTTVTTPKPQADNIQTLPAYLQGVVDWYKKEYTGIHIGVGIYSLDGKSGYVYNENEEISGGCTVKAAYTLFTLEQMPKTGYNIWTLYLTYQSWMKNTGSGNIQYAAPGTQYTVNTLLRELDGESDNTAYNILVSRFPLSDFQTFLTSIGGQNLYGCQYGKASVTQRKNEWVAILDYINSNKLYSNQLYDYLHNTKYCYLVEKMTHEHDFLHKSGWSTGKDYTSASDVAVIDNEYMIVIMTADYSTGIAHTEVVKSWGTYVEKYVDSIGGAQNLFK